MNLNEKVYLGQGTTYLCGCGWKGPRDSERVRYEGTERHHQCPVCGRDLIVPFDFS